MSALTIASDFIKSHEGCRLTAYRDSVGVVTIGYGHTGPEVRDGFGWSQEQAEEALAADLGRTAASVATLVTPVLSDEQLAALYSFAFNLGVGAFGGSTLLRKVNAGDWTGAAAEFPKWDHAGGVEVKGLLVRRQEEAAMFLRGS